MKESFALKATIDAGPSDVYNAWLSSVEHTEMTGGRAFCSNQVGGEFEAWDGYIFGKNIELIYNQKIIQTWRTAEFSVDDEDSILHIELTKVDKGTGLTLLHTNIPQGQTQYKQGWIDHYFEPMKEYFNR